MDRLLKYYGVDWLGMILVTMSIVYMGKQRRSGFIYGAVGCGAWLAFGIMTESVASMIANTTYMIMNLNGYRKWKEKPPCESAESKE
jgi:hypothetical protein